MVVKYNNSSFMGGGNDKWGYIDTAGEYIMRDRFDRVEPFNEKGYALVANEKLARGNRWFIIDKKGKKQHNNTFEDKPTFINGLAVVNIGGLINRKYVLIDDTGTLRTDGEFSSISNFQNGKALAVEKGGDRYYIDIEGNPIEEDEEVVIAKEEAITEASSPEELKKALLEAYDQVLETEGGFWVSKDKLKGYINYKGEIVIPVKYWQLGQFHNGLAFFCPEYDGGFGTKYGYIITKGEIIVKPKYQEASNFSEGLAVVGKVSLLGRKVGYIDTEGNVAIRLKYYTASPFVNGKATVNDGGYFNPDTFIIDKKGNTIE